MSQRRGCKRPVPDEKMTDIWSIADTFNGLMSIPNLIALLLLSGTVAQLTKEYFEKEKV